MRKNEFIPMNLQLFAEPAASGDGDGGNEPTTGGKSGEGSNKTDPDNDDDDGISLAEQVAQLKVQNAKLKKASDKATSEAASYKKQLREPPRKSLYRKRQKKKPRGRNSSRSCFVKIQLQSLRRISLHLVIPRIWLQRQQKHSVIMTRMSFSVSSRPLLRKRKKQ